MPHPGESKGADRPGYGSDYSADYVVPLGTRRGVVKPRAIRWKICFNCVKFTSLVEGQTPVEGSSE